MYRLAIDLGTSNTVAVLRDEDGRIRPVLFDGREQLPSAVHAGTGGALVAGPDAERLARADPAAFEPNPKRRVDDGTVLLGRHTVDVADVLAAVLSAVASRLPASPAEGCVVLTVPAGWGSPRREVLAGAAERAGLGAVEFLSEPVAAAAYFTATLPQDLPPGAALLVVDLGAGTADLAVVRGGRVVAQGGLDVGGLDVDAALVGVLGDVVSATEPEVWHRLAAPATAADRRDRLLLWQEVRAAKESLSRLSVAPVHVPGCRSDPHLTREELEAAAAPLLARIADLAAALTGHQPVGLPAAGVVADPAGTGGSLAASGVGPAAPAQGFTAPDGGFAAPAGEPAAVAGEAAGHAGGWPRSFSSAGGAGCRCSPGSCTPVSASRPPPSSVPRPSSPKGAARHGGRGAGGHRRAGRSAGGRAGRRGGRTAADAVAAAVAQSRDGAAGTAVFRVAVRDRVVRAARRLRQGAARRDERVHRVRPRVRRRARRAGGPAAPARAAASRPARPAAGARRRAAAARRGPRGRGDRQRPAPPDGDRRARRAGGARARRRAGARPGPARRRRRRAEPPAGREDRR
ncbi:Hsp70 family protein [Dactylosporangium sp. NBC_01737]|uniref:Hsp70 family protein n=1 Tax=Dactylosporangium sp. NBC_01737 TaxID=2975959 RepID=UPI002E10023D|nr:Hsp70 family protein [Dactylosporangium sp. NBC_01737]